MTEYHVSKTGSESGDGTEGDPFLHIQQAADVMVAGDVALAHEGIYDETVVPYASGVEGAPIAYSSYPGELAVLDGDGVRVDGFVARHRQHLSIQDLGIRNYTHRGLYGSNVDFLKLHNCHISDVRSGTAFDGTNTNLTLSRNLIEQCSGIGIGVLYACCVRIDHNTVREIYSTHSSGNGIWVSRSNDVSIIENDVSDTDGNGIGVKYVTDARIGYNRSIKAAKGNNGLAGIGVEDHCAGCEVFGNEVVRSQGSGFLTNSPGSYIHHNRLIGSVGAAASFGDWFGSVPENNRIEHNAFIVTHEDGRALVCWVNAQSYNPFSNTFNYNQYMYAAPGGPDKDIMVAIGVPGYEGQYSFAQWQEIAEPHGELVDWLSLME